MTRVPAFSLSRASPGTHGGKDFRTAQGAGYPVCGAADLMPLLCGGITTVIETTYPPRYVLDARAPEDGIQRVPIFRSLLPVPMQTLDWIDRLAGDRRVMAVSAADRCGETWVYAECWSARDCDELFVFLWEQGWRTLARQGPEQLWLEREAQD